METNKLRDVSIDIVAQLAKGGLNKAEGMVVLAMTLAITFRDNDVSQHEAINRFTTIVKNVYGESK